MARGNIPVLPVASWKPPRLKAVLNPSFPELGYVVLPTRRVPVRRSCETAEEEEMEKVGEGHPQKFILAKGRRAGFRILKLGF